MKDLLLFTNKKMKLEDCFTEIKNKFNNAKENGNGIIVENKNRIYLTFGDERIQNSFDSDTEELQAKVPIFNAFIAHLEVYRLTDAKKIVTILIKLYPDLFINLDDFIDWFGSAEDFISTDFSI